MSTIKTYDAFLKLDGIGKQRITKILKIFEEKELLIILEPKVLQFGYEGQDLDDSIVEIFKQVAEIVRNAKGELTCVFEEKKRKDPYFKFYTIRDGKLWQQDGELVRSEDVVEVE